MWKSSEQEDIFKEVVNLRNWGGITVGKDFFKKIFSWQEGAVPPTPLGVDWGGEWKNEINEKLTFIKKWLMKNVDKWLDCE